MPEVFIDGEVVEFRGESPGTLGDVLNLVQGVLSGQSRLISSVLVDGSEYDDSCATVPFSSASRVQIESLTEGEVVARLAGSCLEEISQVRANGASVCVDVLRSPWSQVRGECVSVAEKFGVSLQNVSSLVVHFGEETEFGRMAASASDALNGWIDAIGNGDAAAVCLGMSRGVLPAFDQLANELSGLARPKAK